MKYAGYMPNDFVNGEGVCVSLWTAGCPHRCPGCFNSEIWDYDNGKTVPNDIKGQIVKAISANGIQRNFSVLGGEPLSPQNREFVNDIIKIVRSAYPHIKIYLWSGYAYQELLDFNDKNINSILSQINFLIDGRFEQDKKDLTLKLRGSSNQNIIELNKEEK